MKVKEVKQKTDIDLFREKAILMRSDASLSLIFGHHHEKSIDIKASKSEFTEGFINKFHRKRILNIFKISGETDFPVWIKTNILKHIK